MLGLCKETMSLIGKVTLFWEFLNGNSAYKFYNIYIKDHSLQKVEFIFLYYLEDNIFNNHYLSKIFLKRKRNLEENNNRIIYFALKCTASLCFLLGLNVLMISMLIAWKCFSGERFGPWATVKFFSGRQEAVGYLIWNL